MGFSMAKKEVAILDFGSQKITAMVGSRDVNNSLFIKCSYSENYEGFLDGAFIEPKKLESTIQSCVNNIRKMSGYKIKKIVVGVPTEFCFCTCKTIRKIFQKTKKINKRDVKSLLNEIKVDIKDHTIINKGDIYFILGENNKVRNPIGCSDSKLSACISFVLADNSFIAKVSNILFKCGIDNPIFTCSTFAQSLYLFDEEERYKYTLLVDCGYITTSVSLCKGNGLLNLSSFSLGGGHIIADLSRCLKIPFDCAESLLKKIVLSIEPDDNDTYDVLIDGKVVPISMKVANAIVESRIEVIAQGIQKSFNLWQYNFPDFIPTYLTGGGISFIKGGKDLLSKILGKNVEIVNMPYSQFNKTNYSSCVAVLNYAIDYKN